MSELEEILFILKSVDEGWSIKDEKDEDDFVILVNSDRERMEDFFPKKELIYKMENLGYFYPIEPQKRKLETYKILKDNSEWVEVTKLSSLIYFYTLAPNGIELLNENNKLSNERRRKDDENDKTIQGFVRRRFNERNSQIKK